MNIESDKYQKQISSIYEQYNKIVAPMVSFLEVIDAEFPIEILNEVRAIFGHFAKTYDDNISIQDIDIELNKAQGHLKRAILDCYKYGCVLFCTISYVVLTDFFVILVVFLCLFSI